MLPAWSEVKIMSSSVSLSEPKFLLDENVHRKLGVFLKAEKFDVLHSPKGISDRKVAALSKSKNRILVTNDSDFGDSALVPKDKIFSVVLLKIPQNKVDSLLRAFSMLLEEITKPEDFEGKFIVLKEEELEVSNIKD